MPEGRLLRAGEVIRQPELADALERLGSDGAEPFYSGDIGSAIVAWVSERGGMLTEADLAPYAVVDRVPVHVSYRGREVVTNPPPSAGGILIAHALGCGADLLLLQFLLEERLRSRTIGTLRR